MSNTTLYSKNLAYAELSEEAKENAYQEWAELADKDANPASVTKAFFEANVIPKFNPKFDSFGR